LPGEIPFFVVKDEFFGRLGERVFHFGKRFSELRAIFFDGGGE